MDTPSLKSLSLVCKCGARLDYTDETWRIEEAREEFARVHAGRQSCAIRDLVAEQRVIRPEWQEKCRSILTNTEGQYVEFPTPATQAEWEWLEDAVRGPRLSLGDFILAGAV